MTETPEQQIARLQSELATAKVDELQAELAAAQTGATPGTRTVQTIQLGGGRTIQLGAGQAVRFNHGLRNVVGGSGGGPETDTRLAPAPRAVPFAYRATLFPFSMWSVFALFMIAVTPIAVYIAIPIAGVAVGVLGFVAVGGNLVRKSLRRSALLKWGEVAAVTNVEVLGRGTYYSGTTVQNVRIAQAQGWQVTRQWYSGPVTKTRISYQVRGTQGSFVLRGLDYEQGVILADPRKPDRALCVSAFPYDLGRDPNGNWTGAVNGRVMLGSFAMVVVLLGWAAGMCLTWGAAASHLHGLVR